jgi:hypothetical protein
MAGREQVPREVAAGEAGGAGDQDSHAWGAAGTRVRGPAAVNRSQTCFVRAT